MIKNKMKARAWMLILMIGMITSTGFCYTPDLIQDSETEMVTSLDVAVDVICVNDVNKLNFVKEYRAYKGDGYLDIVIYSDASCEYAICSQWLKAPDIRVKPLLINNLFTAIAQPDYTNYNYRQSQFEPYYYNRKARDGLCSK